MTAFTRWVRRSPALPISIALLPVLYAVGALSISGFGGGRTVKSILLMAAFLGIVSMGQTLVIIVGGIDLSIPFVVGAANIGIAQLAQDGVPFELACVIVLATAALFGSVNAAISVRCHVHPLLVTLGSGTALLGLLEWWTQHVSSGAPPHWLVDFVSIGSSVGPVPIAPVVVLWGAMAVLTLAMMRRTVFGRRVYALGSSPRAASLALVRPLPIWVGVFSLSSMCSAMVGILFLGFIGSPYAEVGTPYLFETIVAVIIGGASLAGGSGGYGGTIIGVLTLTLLTVVFTGVGLSDAVQQTVLGSVIVLLAAIYGREKDVRMRI